MLDENKALSSIFMDSLNCHMNLEGPNGCGKSTIQRNILYNIILMHVFGIATAEKASVTLLDNILDYSNVSENPKEQLSGFEAQLKAAVV